MNVLETTKPVQRTFAMEDLSELDLRVVRTALTLLVEKEVNYRQEIASQSHTMPQSQEELSAQQMLDSIRGLQRSIFPSHLSDGHGQINAGKVAPTVQNIKGEF